LSAWMEAREKLTSHEMARRRDCDFRNS